MKTVTVRHIQQNKVVDRFLIENEKDIQEAKDNKIIGNLHLAGMRKFIANGEKVILNQSGGYCNMEGTWEFVSLLENEDMTLDSALENELFN